MHIAHQTALSTAALDDVPANIRILHALAREDLSHLLVLEELLPYLKPTLKMAFLHLEIS